MSTGFVLLANSTACDKIINEHQKSRPPEVAFDNSFGSKASEVPRGWGGVDRVK